MSDDRNFPPEPPRAPLNGSDPGPEVPQPGISPNLQPSNQDLKELKKAQTLVMVANIAGPVSLFIGGVLLSSVGLVCAVISHGKFKRLSGRTTRIGSIAAQFKRSSVIGIVLCGIALVLNAIAFSIMLPEVMQMVESGDYAGLTMDAGSGAAGSATWG